jgi:Super-infection exclusion protein B
MAWSGLEFLEVLLKNLTDRIALAVLFIALILIGLAKATPDSGVGQWSIAHYASLWIAVIGTVCYLPTRFIIEATDRGLENRSKHKRLRKHLETLGSDEQSLLYNPIAQKNMSFKTGIAHLPAAKSLERRGIVHQTDDFAFAIDKDAFDYLVAHPGRVGLKPTNSN